VQQPNGMQVAHARSDVHQAEQDGQLHTAAGALLLNLRAGLH
jgi:hypothetical protein